jgi:DNA-binding NarL/FixJ family response regulator
MHEKMPIRVSIADSHRVFRHGIKLALKDKDQLQIIWEAESGLELLARLDEERPDVLLLNLDIPGVFNRKAIPLLRLVYNPVKIIVLTLHNDAGVITKIMDTGANACFPRATNPEEIYKAIQICLKSGFYFNNLVDRVGLSVDEVQRIYCKSVKLSEKEVQLLRLLSEDKLTGEISRELRLSARRVEALRQDMKAKIGAKTIAGLIALGVRNKLID